MPSVAVELAEEDEEDVLMGPPVVAEDIVELGLPLRGALVFENVPVELHVEVVDGGGGGG